MRDPSQGSRFAGGRMSPSVRRRSAVSAARLIAWARADLGAEAPRLALWTPALIGLGVFGWFYWPGALAPGLGGPAAATAGLCLLASAACGRAARRAAGAGWIWSSRAAIALAAIAAGAAAADFRAERVAGPIWPPAASSAPTDLTARVLAHERTARGAPRLLLDRVAFESPVAPAAPERLRVTLPGASPETARALVGRRIAVTARLFAPPPPVEPGALDLRRRAFFERVGAYGRADGAPRDLGPSAVDGLEDAAMGRVRAWRAALSTRAQAAGAAMGLPDAGAIVAALLVGDRTGAPPLVVQNLRDSNLAHLLAISGLHMALISLSVFAAARMALALLRRGPFGLDPKKLAAVAAIAAATLYLALSGGALATQRAYIMAMVAFGAVLLDRPAVTLRAVALAAILILLYAPESLLDPGFQLSFAATTALVAAFQSAGPLLQRVQASRRAAVAAGRPARAAGLALLLFIGGFAVSSLVAGLATAPFAAGFFNRMTHYGLIANLLATPMMGAWIMPMGAAAIALAPVGLDTLPLQAAAIGVGYVLWIAETVASWPGATSWIPAGDTAAPLIALGGLMLCLAAGWLLRAAGATLLVAAALVWTSAPRPDVLIAPGGRLVGVMTREVRALDRPRGSAFAAAVWLRRDGLGDAPETVQAARARAAFARFGTGWSARLADGARVEFSSAPELNARALGHACRGAAVLIAPRAPAPAAPPSRCVVLTGPDLTVGAALWRRDGRWRLVSADGPPRPWTTP